jgi:hypothetical protein
MTLQLNNFYHKIFTESSAEFEEIRQLCLSEDNWLRDLYSESNLKIEKHSGYCVVFDQATSEPVGMAGIFNDGRYPSNVARHLHREYTFPKWRKGTRQGIIDLITLYNEHIITPLNAINNYDVYIVAMQNRYKKQTKGYWNIFSNSVVKVSPVWKIGSGYIQTCPFNVQKCWQNYIYCEMKEGAFDQWQKQIISHDAWERLIQGD